MTIGEFLGWIRGLAERIARPFNRDLMTDVRLLIYEDVRSNFEQSKAPDGSQWAPIFHRQGKPLIDTGALMQGALQAVANPRFGDEGDGLVYEAELTSPFYGIFHQLGTPTIHQRRFMGLSEQAQGLIAERYADSAVKFIVNGRES